MVNANRSRMEGVLERRFHIEGYWEADLDSGTPLGHGGERRRTLAV